MQEEKKKKKKKVKKIHGANWKVRVQFLSAPGDTCIGEKKCDTCVRKEPNNGTYLSRKMVERTSVRRENIGHCIYISFEEECRKAHSQTN